MRRSVNLVQCHNCGKEKFPSDTICPHCGDERHRPYFPFISEKSYPPEGFHKDGRLIEDDPSWDNGVKLFESKR